MPYRLRFLPPEEWNTLQGPLKDHDLHPDHALIVVAEEAGKVVGTWAALENITMEGLWVEEKYRNSPMAVRLYTTMTEELKKREIPGVLAVIANDSVISQAERLGFLHLPGHPMIKRF